MKKFITLWIVLFGIFAYGQESAFTTLNKKRIGAFNAKAQYFFMHRSFLTSSSIEKYDRHDNASSLAFTLNYESPKFKDFSLKFSYLQSLKLQEYFFSNSNQSFSTSGAEKVQNDSFGFLNNLSLNYSLDSFGFDGGSIVLGRFPLDTEFITGYAIRQKEQAYEGLYIDLPNIKNWDFKAGYISQFSNWETNNPQFSPVSTFYGNSGNLSTGQTFAEASYADKEGKLSFAMYYAKVHKLLDVLGFSFLKKIVALDDVTNFYLRSKNVLQSGKLGSVVGIQPGILFTHKTFTLESGIFSVQGNTAIQNPFGAKWIISEPLFEIDFQRQEKSETYYIESVYRFDKGKIYALYLRTSNPTNSAPFNVTEEYNLIASYEIKKRLNAAVKLAFFRGDSDVRVQQLLDARLVLSYSF